MRKRLFSIEIEQKICDEYHNHISPMNIATCYRCDFTTIYNILKRHNIKRQGRSYFLTETPFERFQRKYEILETGCWQWHGTTNSNRYGFFHLRNNGQKLIIMAHRFSYEVFKGPIPKGYQLHHLCQNPACVNPNHLEPKTPRHHTLDHDTITGRNHRKTHCKHGHKFMPENTYIRPGTKHRACKECAKYRRHLVKSVPK